MAKINILPTSVFMQIAAGEIVDRPYSVVKELVENSIDAGATEIEIYVEKGGTQLIRIVDNGCGIERADLQSAFLPHATSKITSPDDMPSVMTLGFRGEAVAAVASISKMTFTSQVEGEKCYSLTSEFGNLGIIKEATGQKGTIADVESLFYNTPVRLKFLKSEKAEEAEITTLVSKFILSHYDIAFSYYLNGEKVLQSFGDGMEEAFVCVYGAQARTQCIEIDAEKHGLRLRGFIGNQNFSKPNKSYQSVFLNGRYIINPTIAAAVSGAYSSYLMKRQYPFYVLYVTAPRGIFDVNVHPNKADVRFTDNGTLYGCVYSIISSILDGKSSALEYIVPDANGNATQESATVNAYANRFDDLGRTSIEEIATPEKNELPRKTLSESILEQPKEEVVSTENKRESSAVFGFPTLPQEIATQEIERLDPFEKAKHQKPFTPTSMTPIPHENGFIPREVIDSLEEDPKNIVYMTEKEFNAPKKGKVKTVDGAPEKLLKLFPGAVYKPPLVLRFEDPNHKEEEEGVDAFEENKKYLQSLENKAKQDAIDVTTCVYVGKLFNTYLLYQQNEDMLVIDQHAAHERLLFDKLKARMQSREGIYQPLLIPYELHLNAFEATFIRERMEEIRSIGFELEETGATDFKVTAVPVDIPRMDIGSFFNHILGDINGYRAIKLEDIVKDKLASAACKAAIKGGMDISRKEIDELFKQMDGDMGLKCPHGRPVVVKISKTQLEKMFKRIV